MDLVTLNNTSMRRISTKLFSTHPRQTTVSGWLSLCMIGITGMLLTSVSSSLSADGGPPPVPHQLPTGEQVVGGQAQISRQQAMMTIDQATPRAAIDWQSFDIGSAAHVDIRQPSSQSVLLNQVLGGSPSQIFGNLTANGQVFLTNPNGVYFAPGATVDVGGLVATTHRLSVEDFLAGRDHFTRNGATGTIVNEGQLRASLQGYIALLAPEVRNRGVIIAELGTVALAAGETFTLHFDQQRHLTDLRVEQAALRTLVENGQAVLAPGGYIILSSLGLPQVEGSVIRHTGTLDASSLVSRGGRILLEGDAITIGTRSTTAATGATGGGDVLIGGGWQGSGTTHQATTVTMAEGANIDASATVKGDGGKVVLWSDVTKADSHTTVQGSILAHGGTQGGDGGKVETSGHNLDVGGARVDAGAPWGQGGLWYLDPADSVINQTIANSYASSLNTGTSVLNDVSGSITWDSGVTLNKTAGGDATLTLRMGNYTSNSNSIILNGASIASTSGALNLVLWTKYNATNYDGTVAITNSTITTNDGHVWIGGSNNTVGSVQTTTWNGLSVGTGHAATWSTNVQGVAINGSTVNTGAGNISINGLSWDSGVTTGIQNAGVLIAGGSTLSTTSGNLSIDGHLNGRYSNGLGVVIGNTPSGSTTGNVLLSTTSGNISITGTGTDAANSGTGWRHALLLYVKNATEQVTVRSTSGSITLDGQGQFSSAALAGSDSSGLQIQSSSTTSPIKVVSQSGQITLRGSNTLESSQYLNGIRLTSSNAADNIRIGYDGTNAYSGDILIEANSILQHSNQTGTGSLSVQGTGSLTIRPIGSNFTQLRAGDSGSLSFDNDWNFGSTLSGFTLGKVGNTANITLASTASINGPISIYGGTVTLNAGLTTSNASTGDVAITASTGLTGSGGVALANDRTLTVTQTGNTSYSGVISGTNASFVKNGVGDLTLAGASTYGGSTTVTNGILSLGGADRLPDSTALTVGTGGTFSLNGYNETVGSIAGSGLIVNGAVVRDGLVLWLDAGNTASYSGSGSTWSDLSGNGYHATLVGNPSYSSANSLFTFTSNSQYVQLATLPADFLGSTVTGMTAFTVANFGATADNWERVVDLGNTGAGGNAANHNIILSRFGNTSRLNFEIYNGVTGGTENKTGTNSAITNSKVSYAGTADGSNLMIYKDGTLNTTTASTALPAAVARNNNYIGKSNWTADDTFRGDIGTVMVYNRALSATEISKNHQLLFNRSAATLTVGNDNTNTTFSGNLENGVGTLNVVKAGNGTLTLTGANSYAGTTTVSAGTLNVGGGGATGTLGSGAITTNAALVFNHTGSVVLSALASNAAGIGGTGSVNATSGAGLTIDRPIGVTSDVTLTASSGNLALDSAVASSGTAALAATGTMTDGASGSLTAPQAVITSGDVILDSASTNIGTLAASGVTGLLVRNSNALTVGTVGATTGISTSGNIDIATASGDLTVAANVTTTSTSALMLNAGRSATAGTASGGNLVLSGSPLITVGSGGRATLYSGSVSGSTGVTTLLGSGSGRFRYNSDESVSNFTAALGSGLYGIYREQPTLTVTSDNQTITYGNALPTFTFSVNGINGDTSAQIFGTNPTISAGGSTSSSGNLTAGTHSLTGSGGADQLGYAIGTYTPGTLTVNQKPLTYAGTATDKVYDGNTSVTLSHAASGMVSGDSVTFSGTGTFSNKHVGANKVVAMTGLTAGGTDGSNYTLASTASSSANITTKAVTVSGLTATNKVYDGTTVATVNHVGALFTGQISGDVLTAAGSTGTFATKQVGTGKTVTLSGTTYGGADAGNYTFTDQASTTADITAKGVTVSGLTAANKVYDGTTAATINHAGAVFTGQISGDVLTVVGSTGTFTTKQVGTGKTVTLSGTTYGGADAGNYTFTDQASTTADITTKPLMLDLQGQGSKVYDGSTSITLTGITPTVSGVVSGDTVTATTGSVTGFADKHAGTNKAVLFSGFGLSGADATNYLLVSGSAPSTATIMPKAVVVSGLTANNKVYDGTTAATVNHSGIVLTGLLAGDSVTASGTVGTFADPAAGAGKLVALSSTLYGGADADNYTFTGQIHTTADILAATGGTAGQSSIGEVINGVIQLGQGIRLPVGSPSTMPGTPSQALPNYSASALIGGPQGQTFISLNSATASSRTQSTGVVVDLVQQVSAARNGIVTVSIPKSLLQRHESLVFSLPAELVTALGDKPDQFTQMGGEALPYWLRYDPKEGTFHIPDTTSSPLPISIVTVFQGQRIVVTITEKTD